MPGRWLRAHVQAMPQIEAERQLQAIEAAVLPWVKASLRRQRISLWQSLLRGTVGRDVDTQGRVIMTTVSQISAWLSQGGVAVQQPETTSS